MEPIVIIAWRDHPSRREGFRWVYEYYRHRIGENNVHVEVNETTGPFNRSAVFNAGVKKFPGRIAIIADADCFLCDHSLKRAIREAGGVHSDKLIIPHSSYCYTNYRESAQILKMDPRARVSGKMFRHRRKKHANGGIWVLRSDLFLENLMDERFIGHGSEDTEYALRMNKIRYSGPIFHIAHEKQSRAYAKRNHALLRKAVNERKQQEVAS